MTPNCKGRHKISNNKTSRQIYIYIWKLTRTFFNHNTMCFSVYTDVHDTQVFFLIDSRACNLRSRSVFPAGHCTQETDFNTQSCQRCLFCPCWGDGLTFQDRFVITDSKDGLGKTTKKSHLLCRFHLRVTGNTFGMSVAIRQGHAKEDSSQVSAL